MGHTRARTTTRRHTSEGDPLGTVVGEVSTVSGWRARNPYVLRIRPPTRGAPPPLPGGSTPRVQVEEVLPETRLKVQSPDFQSCRTGVSSPHTPQGPTATYTPHPPVRTPRRAPRRPTGAVRSPVPPFYVPPDRGSGVHTPDIPPDRHPGPHVDTLSFFGPRPPRPLEVSRIQTRYDDDPSRPDPPSARSRAVTTGAG